MNSTIIGLLFITAGVTYGSLALDGIYNATLGAGMLAASVTFGVLYERFGAGAAFGTGAGLATAAALALLLVRTGAGQDAKMVGSDVSNSRHQ